MRVWLRLGARAAADVDEERAVGRCALPPPWRMEPESDTLPVTASPAVNVA